MGPINSQRKTTSTMSKSITLLMTGSLMSEDVEDARKRLSEVIGQSDHIVIDCHGLQELDEHGLVFLCSAHRHFINSGRFLEFSGLSPELVSAAKAQRTNFLFRLSCDQSKSSKCIWK